MPRGQKTCPSCGHGTGPKAAECPECGHVYYKRKTPKPVANGSGRRGFRLCPSCGEENHVRRAKCSACEADMVVEIKTAPVQDEPDAVVEDVQEGPRRPMVPAHLAELLPPGIPRSVDTPAGACPVKLNELTPDAVRVWGGLVVAAGCKGGLIYSPNALRYFMREFMDCCFWTHPAWAELSAACEEIEV